VRHGAAKETLHLVDTRRLNVAISRAKAKLIIVEDRQTLVTDVV
jgi:superfamily I DNA and/or RNA helicase